jgi:hypothetical protein
MSKKNLLTVISSLALTSVIVIISISILVNQTLLYSDLTDADIFNENPGFLESKAQDNESPLFPVGDIETDGNYVVTEISDISECDEQKEVAQILMSIAPRMFEEVVDELGYVPEVDWISLSYDMYSKKREAIKEYFREEFEGTNYLEIAIGLYDLNDDGADEIITFITASGFQGARQSGHLFVMTYDGNDIALSRSISGFALDIDTLDDVNSKQIGVANLDNAWADLVICIRDTPIGYESPVVGFWRTEPYNF